MAVKKPVLSIGIIFKNEIRCLERCLQSLQPLREMVSCELVMADTGSDDGSRQVAEKYADILFDFEWINDFAAARNAVMDRCSGKWYLSIDCDEWLGGDAVDLAEFAKNNQEFNYGGLTVRNYKTTDLDKGSEYTDFTACRLLRMSTGLRFVGAIHERWPSEQDGSPQLLLLQRCFLHHDGYVYADPVAAKAKMERNMALLQERLNKDPKNLVTLLQCIESSDGRPECLEYIKEAARGVEEKWDGWDVFGAPIFRYAATAAFKYEIPEMEKFITLNREWFSNSIYTRIDTEFSAFGLNWSRNEYKECIKSGKRYLKALSDYEANKYDPQDSLCSTLSFRSLNWKMQVLIFMAASYLYEKQPEKAREILDDLEGSQMGTKHVGDCIRVYIHLHSRSNEDTAPLITKLWDEISQPTPNEERASQRKAEFIRMASEVFLPAYQEDEQTKDEFLRHAYTLFLPLEGRCILGDASAILKTDDAAVLEEKLGRVEDMAQLPVSVLYHAMERGITFPPAGRRMNLEEMDALAGHMAQDKERLFALTLYTSENISVENRQTLAWARGLVLASVHAFDWTGEGDGAALARAYARVEQAFLPLCYAPDTLREENLDILPPMHRFGWYLPQAFQTLDNGDTAGYVYLLRKGLETCPSVKPMVEFLLRQLEESRRIQATPELLALVDQVRTLLAAYPADDPAVEALKQSATYQAVAHLIEDSQLSVREGAAQ